jgi:small subunit ribosomal protein S3
MGQKVHPIGIRLGIVKDWSSRWYAKSKDFADTLISDLKVRQYLKVKLAAAGISRIQIDRPARNARITVEAARPGTIIGKSGKEIENIRDELNKILGVPVHISIEEVRKPELDAKLPDNLRNALCSVVP